MELLIRELTSDMIAKKMKEAEQNGSGRCWLGTVDYFEIICDALNQLSNKKKEIIEHLR